MTRLGKTSSHIQWKCHYLGCNRKYNILRWMEFRMESRKTAQIHGQGDVIGLLDSTAANKVNLQMMANKI